MRPPTAAFTAVAAVAALVVGWHEGSRPHSGLLAGVHVIAAPPAPAPTAPITPGGDRPRRSRKSTKTKAPTRRATTASAPSVRRTLDGAVVATPYGTVQVSVTLLGHRITDVRALHLTDANDRSRQISAGAAPILRQEALAGQSARIDAVSGATYTSEGYQQSLQAALDQAHL